MTATPPSIDANAVIAALRDQIGDLSVRLAGAQALGQHYKALSEQQAERLAEREQPGKGKDE